MDLSLIGLGTRTHWEIDNTSSPVLALVIKGVVFLTTPPDVNMWEPATTAVVINNS